MSFIIWSGLSEQVSWDVQSGTSWGTSSSFDSVLMLDCLRPFFPNCNTETDFECITIWQGLMLTSRDFFLWSRSWHNSNLRDSVQTLPLIPSCQLTASSGFRNHLTRAYYLLSFFPRNQLFWVRTNAAFLYLLMQIGHFSVKRRRGLDFFPPHAPWGRLQT